MTVEKPQYFLEISNITNVKLHRSIVKTFSIWKIYANWCWFWQTFSYHFQLLQILISRNGILFMRFTLYAMFLVLRRICNTHILTDVDRNLKKSSWHGLNHFKNHCISYTRYNKCKKLQMLDPFQREFMTVMACNKTRLMCTIFLQ